MNVQRICLLLIEDNPGDARLVREILRETPEIDIHTVDRISLGVEYLTSNQTDVVLLDLGLPDSQGLDSLCAVYDAAPNVPIVVLTGHDDEEIGRTAIRQGAQDYLVKPVMLGRMLARILRFAVERKRAEYELSEAEKHYRMLFNAIDEGFCIIEVIFDENEKPIDYRFLEINPSFEKQTGLIDAQGKRMRELAPKHEEHWFEIYGKIAVTGQPARFVNRAEQLHRWYDVYAFRFGQPENRQVAILFNDITERKRVEEALRESHDRAEWLALVPEENPNPVMRLSADGSVLYCNPASVKIPGWACKDGQCPDPLLPLFGQAMAGEQEMQQDVELGERFYSVTVVPIPGKGYANVYGINITDRKRAELRERLAREVLELLNHPENPTDTIRDILQLIKKNTGFEALGIRLREGDDFPYYQTNGFSEDFIQAERYLCARDEEGKIIRDGQGNPVLECMCGNIICNRTNPTLPFFTEGGSFWTNSTTDILASTTEEDRQARTRNRCNGEGYESMALIPLRAGADIIGLLQLNDRRRNRFTLKTICFFEGLGASIGIALTHKRAEEEAKEYSAELTEKNEELRAMTQQLWQAAKLATMGELAASIAHELNNPLATVSMRAESLLTKTQQDSPMWRELKIIEQEVERMAILIANLLQFSRRSQPQKSTVDICEEIEKALELIYYHLRKRSIVIWREFTKKAPHIHADRQQLRQLFLNLFTNASDAMPEGGTLTIRVTAPPESKQVIMEVADTGTGIPPEILPKVVDPFYTTKPEGEGTGLGLAICRRIVQEHNGTFDLTSEGIPGKGTTARISLPVTNGTNAAGLKNQ